MDLLTFLIAAASCAPAGAAFACWRLRGGRSFTANVRRVLGMADLGGPDGGNPPPPRP